MGQTLLLLPALDSSTGREISSQWGHRTPLQTGDQSLPCPGIQPHLSVLLQRELFERSSVTTMAVSFLPSTPFHLSIIYWV